jgi:putative sterol carrier protein
MIFCAGGSLLRTPDLEGGTTWYTDAVREAGREVVEQGHISEKIQSILDRSLMEDQELFANMLNAYWQSLGLVWAGTETETKPEPTTAISASATPLSTPCKMDTISDLVAGMAFTFNHTAAGDLCAVVQFIVTDEEPGKYFLEISDGGCIAYSGEHSSPTATITTPAAIWMDIARGKLNGATAFMTGQYKVSGDIGLLMQFPTLFPRTGQ